MYHLLMITLVRLGVYFLKSKDEVLGEFKEFKALVENLCERKIKILRSDNGGEYTSNEFGRFCRDVKIKKGSHHCWSYFTHT